MRLRVHHKKKRAVKLSRQVVGDAGLYYTCFHPSLRGWNAMPTARNAHGIDIVAYDRTGRHFLGVQVKALSSRNPVPLGSSLKKVMGDVWVIVNRVTTEPTAFILKSEEVKDLAHRGQKGDRVSYWLQPPAYDMPEFPEAWNRIGRGDEVGP